VGLFHIKYRTRRIDMKNFASTFTKAGAIGALAVSSIASMTAGFAAPAPEPSATSAADLQAKSGHHTMMAADYRILMRTDQKHAISWFTLANHCDQKADRYQRLAVLQSGAEPEIPR
jgi:hypothetical protein